MNGGGESTPKSLSLSPSSHSSRFHPLQSPSNRKHSSPPTSRISSPRASKGGATNVLRGQNGIVNDTVNDNESEAETEIDEAVKTNLKKRLIKNESTEDHRAFSPPTTKSEPARSHPTSRRSSIQESQERKEKRHNGVKDKHSGDGKPKSLSNSKARPLHKRVPSSSRAQSAEASLPRDLAPDSDSNREKENDRSRTSLSVEPRKRKLSDGNPRSKFEPPRQRPRLDSNAKSSKNRHASPQSPVLQNNVGHRRSASSQSGTVNPMRRKKREVSTTSQQSDSKEKWNDDSSDNSSSTAHKDPPIPFLAPPPRSSRLASRALTSPARTGAFHSRRADKYGSTPLAKACEKGLLAQVKKAYEQAPEELNQEDNGGFAPLQKASLYGHYEIVKFLLDKGCRRDCCSKEDRDTPLIDAVENGHLEVVRLLLDNGVNPHHQNKNGNRAIDSIDEEDKNGKEIEAMLNKAMAEYEGSDNENDAQRPASPVISPQNPTSRQDSRPDLLYQAMTKDNLLKYSTSGDLQAVVMLLESVKPDNTCAVAAARGGHDVVLSFLLAADSPRLDKDPDPLKYDETPMLVAIGRGHVKVIQLLLDQDNFNPCRRTKEGKTYYEVAQERRGPRWQAEAELLKERYDLHKAQVQQKVAKKKKTLAEAKASKSPINTKDKPEAPKSPQLSKVKPRFEKSQDDRKSKRPSGSKEVLSKDAQRRKRRVVEDESSHEGDSDTNSMAKPQRRRASSNLHKKSKPDSASPNHSRTEESKGRPGRKPKEHRQIKREPPLDDEDVIMRDSHDSGKHTPEISEADSKAEAKAKEREAEEAKRKAKAAAKEAEQARLKEEAERIKRLEEEEEQKRLEREAFLSSLPLAIRRAIEKGDDRPLRFTRHLDDYQGRTELGILNQFLPLHCCPLYEIEPSATTDLDELWTLSFYLIGLLGLADLSLDTYPLWPKKRVTPEQRERFFHSIEMAPLAHEFRWAEMGDQDYDHDSAEALLSRTREQCQNLDPLWWIRLDDLTREVNGHSKFHGINIRSKRSNVLSQRRTPQSKPNFWDIFDKPRNATPNGYTRSPSHSATPAQTTPPQSAIDSIEKPNVVDHAMAERSQMNGFSQVNGERTIVPAMDYATASAEAS